MTRRLGLMLAGIVVVAAAGPGCCLFGRKEIPIIDQSWYATKNQQSMSSPEQEHSPSQGPIRGSISEYSLPPWVQGDGQALPKRLPPNLDPPPWPELKPDAKPDDKPGPFNTMSSLKKGKENDPPNLKPLQTIVHQEPLTLALQCIFDNRHKEALEHLKKYDATTQELFIRLLPAMAQIGKKSLEHMSPSEISVLHEQLHNLEASLRARTELTIETMCFCEWVKAYGVYKTLPDHHSFTASGPNRPGDRVQLYVELRNFTSEPRQGWFETRLASSVEILDLLGGQVWFKKFDDNKTPYRSQTQLHDYYNRYSFSVPHLPPGNYRLRLQVVDETRPGARRTAQKTLDFRVSALPRP